MFTEEQIRKLEGIRDNLEDAIQQMGETGLKFDDDDGILKLTVEANTLVSELLREVAKEEAMAGVGDFGILIEDEAAPTDGAWGQDGDPWADQ